jgi:hypothetical protein
MTIDIQYRRKQFDPPYYTFAKFLGTTLRTLLGMMSRKPDSSEIDRTAIDILVRSDSSLDDREWAERYLCGMANADRDAFMRNRRRQS